MRIAPELWLKRLVVGGFERVFEIGRVFRNEGVSPRHNPEFTMLEIYAAYWNYEDMMNFTEELTAGVAMDVLGTTEVEYQGRPFSFATPWPRRTMAELTSEAVGEDVSVHTAREHLAELLRERGVEVHRAWGAGRCLAELFEVACETSLWNPIFVTDFPVEISPLARRHQSDPDLVERFESYAVGRELSNGFSELVDPHRPARPLRGSGATRRRGRTGDHAHRRGLHQGPGVGAATDGRSGSRHRPTGDADRRRVEHPRGDRLSDAQAARRLITRQVLEQ